MDKKKILIEIQTSRKEVESTKLAMLELREEQKKHLKQLKDDKATQSEVNKVKLSYQKRLKENSDKLRELTKEQKLNEQIVKSEKGSYDRLNAQLKKAELQWRKLSDEQRKNTTVGKNLQKQRKDLNTQLKQLDQTGGVFYRNVGKYTQGIMNFAGQLGLAVGAAMLFRKALDTIKKSIMAVQTTGDEFNKKIAGMKEAYNSFLRGVSTGGTTFNELITNFKDAIQVGREYMQILDDLGDRQRSLRILESDARKEQVLLLAVARDELKSNNERIAAIDKYIEIEKELQKTRVKTAKSAYAAELLIAQERSDLSQKEIEDFLRNQDKYIEIVENKRKLDEEYASKVQQINTNTNEGAKAYQEAQMEYLAEMLVERNKEEKALDSIIEKSSQLSDEIRDRLVVAYTELNQSETSAIQNTIRLNTLRGTLIKEIERGAIRIMETEELIIEDIEIRDKEADRYVENELRKQEAFKKRLEEEQKSREDTKKAIESETKAYYLQGVAAAEAGNTIADQAKNTYNVIRGNIMKKIQARLAEAITAQLAKVFETVPFPINAIVAPIAGAGIQALFKKIIPKFERGGQLYGASHSSGGIQLYGRGGSYYGEAEGGEVIINKRSSAIFKDLLSEINSYNGYGKRFATGGVTTQIEAPQKQIVQVPVLLVDNLNDFNNKKQKLVNLETF